MGGNRKIAENMFITMDGERTSLPVEFVYDLMKFEDYELIKNNTGLFLAGKRPIIVKQPSVDGSIFVGNITETVKCSTSELFFAFLNLIDNIGEFPIGDSSEIERIITDVQIETIIKWCIKNGLPLESHRTWEPDAKKKLSIQGFRIGDFMFLLRDLRYLFNLFLATQGIEVSGIIGKKPLKDCVNSLKFYLSTHLNLRCAIDYESGFKYLIKANNLFEAAQYEFILLISSPTGTNIKRCECCHEWFQPIRKNQKYCPLCSPQKAYKRKKSKGEKQNGDDSETGE